MKTFVFLNIIFTFLFAFLVQAETLTTIKIDFTGGGIPTYYNFGTKTFIPQTYSPFNCGLDQIFIQGNPALCGYTTTASGIFTGQITIDAGGSGGTLLMTGFYSPPVSGIVGIDTNDILQNVGTLFSDLWVLIAVAIGVPLAFYVIKKVIALTPKR